MSVTDPDGQPHQAAPIDVGDAPEDPVRRGGFSPLALFLMFRRHLPSFTGFAVLQAASYLIPIVTIPYFARTLTIAGMGHIAIAGAVALAAGVLLDYGIVLSGPRFAARNDHDPQALSDYLDATSTLKLLLFLPAILGLMAAAFILPDVRAHFWVFAWSMISATAMGLFPQWLFQGLQIIPIAARILVVTRVLAAVAGIALVRSPADVYVVPMTQALAGIASLAAAMIVLRRRFGIRVGLAARAPVRALLRDNWKLFSATAWGATHTHGSIVLMGVLLPASSVGYYSIAQRISQAFVSMFNIAAQTGFPIFVRAQARQATSFGPRVRLYLALVSAAAAVCLFGMYLLREPIYAFFAGRHSDMGIMIFSIWLFASFFTVLSVSLNPIMVALQLDSRMASVYRITGIGFLILAPLGSFYFDAVGVALATLFPECFMAIYCLIVVNREMKRTAPAPTISGS